MVLERWPHMEELGDYGEKWAGMAGVYVMTAACFEDQRWFLELEALALSQCIEVDGVRNIRTFIEVFYGALPYFHWDAYLILRQVSHLL